MEKISGEDLVETTNAVNELIDWVHKFEADSMWTEEKIVKNIEEVENRLKTLEDKVNFIMRKGEVYEDNGEIFSLQDLYNEQFEEPTVNTKLLKEEAKRGYGHACSAFMGVDCAWCGRKAKPTIAKNATVESTVKCTCGEQTMIGEAGVEIGGVFHRVVFPCYVKPTNKSEKIEEIISKVEEWSVYGDKELESWLRDKLNDICK